jgi:hypothetical protein
MFWKDVIHNKIFQLKTTQIKVETVTTFADTQNITSGVKYVFQKIFVLENYCAFTLPDLNQ